MKTTCNLVLGLLCLVCGTVRAQETGGLHPAAAVEIQSGDRGFLPPRVTRQDREDMMVDSTADGLIVYQLDGNVGFYLVMGGKWAFMNPLLLPDTDDNQEEVTFARVAYTGDYNDLKNRPAISQGGDTVSYARVAYTGDYNDLLDKPIIPQSLSEVSKVALSGDYNDLLDKPTIPKTLRELAQDSLHRLVTTYQKQDWNRAASRSLPTDLSKLNQDELHQTLSELQRQTWDASSARRVPTRLADLQQDEWAQTVSDADKARWDSAAARVLPTRLRDLAQDSLHRLLTAERIKTYQEASERKIPVYLSDLETDERHLTLSRLQTIEFEEMTMKTGFSGDYNDLTNKPDIPDSLSQILGDDFYSTVTVDDIHRWGTMLNRKYRTYLTDLEADAGHLVPTAAQVRSWNLGAERSLPQVSAAAVTGDYNDLERDYRYKPYSEALALTGNFRYINNMSQDYPKWAPVAETGDYNDLTGRPEVVYHNLREVKYRDMRDTPVYAKVALTGDYNDLADAGEWRRKSRYGHNATSLHIGKSAAEKWKSLSGTLQAAPAASNSSFTGSYKNLTVKKDVLLPNSTYLQSVSTEDNSPVTFAQANAMDAAAAREVGSAEDILPCGSVIMWYPSNNEASLPEGWAVLDHMPGRFPVDLGGDFGNRNISDTGGEEKHRLTLEEMPSHKHNYSLAQHSSPKNANGLNHIPFAYGNSHQYITSYTGGDQPHENLPPYFALYILKKTRGCSK